LPLPGAAAAIAEHPKAAPMVTMAVSRMVWRMLLSLLREVSVRPIGMQLLALERG
jgi:hypothetical protein